MTERHHITLCLLLAVACALGGCEPQDAPSTGRAGPGMGMGGIRYLADGDAAQGFARATAPRSYFIFPADHAVHPEFRTEWWYFTGNVLDSERNHYGFELTLFRIAASAASPPRESRLATNEVWMAHLAVTDTARREFQVTERLSRGAPGLAGVTPAADAAGGPLMIRVEDFSIAFNEETVALEARDAEFGIDLELTGLSRIVLQGQNGLDRKGPEPGNASYYYSAPRLSVRGELASAGADAVAVQGSAWMDREWSTSALSPDIAGWDWFALQLDDGRDLMFYRLRRNDGGTSEFSGGSIAAAGGAVTRLGADAVQLAVTRTWTSQRTSVRYPVEWQLEIPNQNLELRILPRLDDQEIDESVRYWEGAVRVRGTAGASGIEGVGYLELAGY